MRKHMCKLLSVFVLGSAIFGGASMAAANNVSGSTTLVKIPFGSETNQLGITPQGLETITECPQSFFVNNKEVYVLDSVKKRIAVYDDKGSFLNSICLDFIAYPKDMLIDNNRVYILSEDPDSPAVYILDTKGQILGDVPLSGMEKGFVAKSLSIDKAGKVCVTTDKNKEFELTQNGVIKTSDARTSPYSSKDWKIEQGSNKMHLQASDASVSQPLDIYAQPGGAEIVGSDSNGNTYVMVGDMADTSLVMVESTVRSFDKEGNPVGVVRLPLEDCTNFPQRALDVKNNGDIYFMAIKDNNIEIDKLTLGKEYKSNILEKQTAEKAKEQKLSKKDSGFVSASVTPNSRTTTQSRADQMAYLSWYYSTTNGVNPSPTTVTRPDWLTSYGWKTGIPYCWGGFDGKDRASSTAWTSFIDAMNKGKFAGNVNCTGGYKTGTAGVDCSGYVGAAVGYTSKPGTTTIYNDTHSHTVSQRDMSDVYVKSGVHVLFYFQPLYNGTGVSSYESTTTGNDKAQLTSRTNTWLSTNGYSLRSWW